MTKIISVINLKGGVGKTATTLALGEFLSSEKGKRVLIIDLDPQTNATVALIGEREWKRKDDAGETLLQLFRDKIDKTSKFSFSNAVSKKVSSLNIQGLDLLPSSLGLIDIQDQISTIPAGQFYSTTPTSILKEAVEGHLSNYDYVLIDCPPNLGIITLNGILISDHFIIPTIPDIMSTYGIPQILNRIKDFSTTVNKPVTPLGIVISMYRAQSSTHTSTVADLNSKHSAGTYPYIFSTHIKLNKHTADASDFTSTSSTLKQKYGTNFECFYDLCEEFLRKI